MKSYKLDFLNNKTIKCIYEVSIADGDSDYILSDTLILKLDNDSLIQIVVNYEVLIYELSSIKELVLIGEYAKNLNVKLIKINEVLNNQKIYSIHNYFQSTYHFGSKFLNINNKFLFGLCFGWDEIILLDENEFDLMLDSYEDKTETINPPHFPR
jgi:hypothetical protein